MYLLIVLSTIYKTGMITMHSNSLIHQHNMNVNELTCHITMTLVPADSSCSVGWLGTRAACAEVSTGSVEACGLESLAWLQGLYGPCSSIWTPVYTEDPSLLFFNNNIL
jgi:hypothetical protein